MRILVIENELSSRRGGQELSLRDVCRGLAERGHSVTLLYLAPGDLEPAYREFCERLVRVTTYRIDRDAVVTSISEFIQSLLRGRRERPDVVYANQYLDSLYAGVLARLCRVPFVCHLRLPPPDGLCGQYRVGMSQVSRLVAISEQTRSDWVARGFRPEMIDVVYNGIDGRAFPFSPSPQASRRPLGIPHDAFVVSYVGRLHPAKGLETLLDAFAHLGSHVARLIISGRPGEFQDGNGRIHDYRRELQERARRLGIESSVTWIEHCDDVVSLFSASDATVLPSLWSEPFGRVLIESMACGTPAIGSRAGGIPEILTGEFAALTFPAGNAGELTALLQKLGHWRTNDPDLGTRCRAHVERRFPLERTVEGVERVLLNVMERATAGEPLDTVEPAIH